jgi:hypothetical protein
MYGTRSKKPPTSFTESTPSSKRNSNLNKKGLQTKRESPRGNVKFTPLPPSSTIVPLQPTSAVTDIKTETTQAMLSTKSKEELIDMLAKLIDDENKTDDGKCNSDKIKNMLNDFINKYKPSPAAVPATSKDIDVIMDVYADTDKNSKGYHIYNYKIRAANEEYPFSTDDEVKYFLKHLFGYIENANLPIEARKEDISNFFKSYSKTFKEIPIVDEKINKTPIEGGNKKKSRAKRSQKRNRANTRKRGSRKSVKKH